MSKVVLSLAVFSILLCSCGSSPHEESNIQTEVAEQNEHHHEGESEGIELNNGKKWIVDANMITHIRNMENDVISFDKGEQKEYQLLSEKLQSNIDLLASNCTMKGKAHDELHKWLLPYIDTVRELSEAKDETGASEQFEKIQVSFTIFNQYFQ